MDRYPEPGELSQEDYEKWCDEHSSLDWAGMRRYREDLKCAGKRLTNDRIVKFFTTGERDGV